MQHGDFELHYQPQLRLKDNMLTGMETLVRWRHATRGLVFPNDFIPLAEETGLIAPIGEWILRHACRQVRAWLDQGLPPLRVAVNLSARQFNDQHLPTLIECMLRETGIPPELLELELTESLLMTDVNAANKALHELKSLGVTLALDDFGTGYSSLAQLKRFPLDILKIDRSFIWDISSHPHDGSIVRTIIELAHNLGMTVVAEGVETAEQEAFLRQYGCDAMQGYRLGKPMPAAKFEHWVRKRSSHSL